MRQFRVLSLDGTSTSGGSGYLAIGMLRQLQYMCSNRGLASLLNAVDVFAGTSAGAANACLFALYEKPEEALDRAIAFWEGLIDVTYKLGISPLRELGAVIGKCAVVSTENLRSYFISHFGETTRLIDLKKKVVIPAFQLDSRNPSHRAWKPKVFHNFGGLEEPDSVERVVDVVMRSGSPPILTPIYQGLMEQGPGYVDGGIFANNPSLVALAQVLGEFQDGDWKGQGSLDDVRILSLGTGDAPVYLSPRMSDGFADWGYAGWLLRPTDLGTLVYAMLDSGVMATTHMAYRILGNRYQRVNPILPGQIRVSSGRQVPEAILKVLALPNTQEQLRATVDWAVESGWVPKPPAPPKPPAG